jgi:alpha-1,3-rhamnosyltransferase
MNQARSRNQQEVFVLVPSYNHAPFVEKCLRSIFAQTLVPKKLLVIDDGSKDDSVKIIEKVLKDCPFESELIARKNQGLCSTLNEGFAASSGKYFAYIGSDDVWLPKFLQERAKLLDERETAVLGYGHAFLINNDDEIYDSTLDDANNVYYTNGDARPMLLRGFAPISSTVFYRREILENVRWNEKAKLEDYEMYLKLSTLGDFAFDPQVLAAWRHHDYNTSRDKSFLLDEVIEAQNRNREVFEISPAELDNVQAKVKFNYARQLLQFGEKKKAWKLASESRSGANSTGELLKFYARMFVPMFVVGAKRGVKKQHNGERFGKIEI